MNALEDLQYNPHSDEEASDAEDGEGTSNRLAKYTCWFQPEYWSKIQAALKLHSYKIRAVVRYLKKRYVMPNTSSMFKGLNESTVLGWFEKDGRTLRPRPRVAVVALEAGESAKNIMHPGRDGVWKGHREVELEFIEWMLKLRDTDVGLNSLLIAFQMKAFILTLAPEIVKSHGGCFKVSRSYVRWCRDRLGWSFRKPTSMASKLPVD